MVGIESMERSIELEDACVKRQLDVDHNAIYEDGTVTSTGDDPVEDDGVVTKYMAAGDIIINSPSAQSDKAEESTTQPTPAEQPPAPAPAPAPAPTTTQTPAAATEPAPAQKKSRFWPLIIGASLLAGGAGTGLGYIMGDNESTDTDTITEMYFDEP